MAEAPVSVSLGVIRSLPAKLERLLSPEANQWLRLRNGEKIKIRLLKDRLQELMEKYLVEPSNVEAPASAARCWVKEVRELSYDIDDFLDELAHGLHSAAARKNLRGRVAMLREELSRSRWVARETARFRAGLEEAIQRHKRYNLDKHQSRVVGIDSDEPSVPPLCGVDATRLMGIDSSIEKLGEWLTGDGEQQLRVVSIVGPGGVGKTTLAKELYCKLGRQFECRAFVRSSQKPDMRRLLNSILLQVRRQRLPNDAELDNLIGTIRAHLQDKNYFIIIDDLWASLTWDIVSRALPDDKCCSRVLITMESDVVAQICSGHNSKHIFKMEPLSDDESTKIFFSRFPGNHSTNNQHWYEVSSEIIRKCGGFPLATITTASLLVRHQTAEQCNWIRRSLSSNLRTDPTIERMKQILSLCYNNLTCHLKACMLYLSIYKEDHIISKDNLVKQWIAEGFICAKERKGKEEVASTYFDELVSWAMIQPVDINYNGEVLSCTVHYMILNLIRYKSIEENFVTAIDHSQANIRLADKVRRLSLQFGDAEYAAQPTKLRLLQVQSLAYFGLLKSLPSISELRLLRVMILHLWGDQDNKRFNLTTVCQLFRLRYLEIVCNVTLDLQTKMQDLQHLETLIIDSRITEVPLDIVHLPGLRYLRLPGDTNLPNGIGQLTSLHALGSFDLSSNSADNVLNLGKLTNLRDLRLICSTMPSDNLEKKLKCLGSILSNLSSLKSLTVLVAGSSNATLKASASSSNISCDSLSSVSSPPALLQKLELSPQICIFSILPDWIGKLRLLVILKIQVMGLSSNDVDILEGLPALSALLLYVRTASTERVLLNKEGGFPVLKHFKFICPALCIAFANGAMPNVRRLKLGFNANTLAQHNTVDAGFEHLIGLEEISAKIGNAGADESSRMAAQSALEAAFIPCRVNIKLVDWTFYGEKERSTKAQKEKPQTQENSNPIPGGITKESSHEQYGIGEKGSKQDKNKRSDNRITVSLGSSDEHQEIQEMGSMEATSKQHGTGITLSLESSDEQQEIQEMGSVGATRKQHGTGITVPLESVDEQQEIQEMSSVKATRKQCGTGITVSLESSVEQQEIHEMGSVEATSKQHGTGISVLLESSDEQEEIQEMGSVEATTKQLDTRQAPSTGSLSLPTPISFASNPNIRRPGTMEPSPGASHFSPPLVQSPGNCSSYIGTIATGVSGSATLLLAIPAICCAWCRCRKSKEHFFDVQSEDNKLLVAAKLGQLKRFSFWELKVATDVFSNRNLLGRGGFGNIYKGRLADGSLIAVRRLKEITPATELQFETEVEMSGMVVAHRNLLRVCGFCMTSEECLLVYPYMGNGSVASRLRGRKPFEPPLDWQTRTRIALGSARGLSCLHDQCDPKIIHRDVKASNILLDEDFEALVGNFNLAKLMDHNDADEITTLVRGTIGHIAPEYLSTGRISEKIDVYGYGMMLLELITGQRAFDLARLANNEDVMLLDWVKGLLKQKKVEMIVDPDIHKSCIDFEVESLIQVALLCTQRSPVDRPPMSEVVRMLEGNGLDERWEEWQQAEAARWACS